MTGIDEARGVLRKITAFDFSDAEIETLAGGLTNRSFLVRMAQAWFVLRLSDNRQLPVGVDRRRELRVHEAASAAGIAPTIVYASVDDGILLTEYVAGAQLRVEELERRVVVEQLAALLHAVHELPVIGPPLDMAIAARQHRERIDDDSFARLADRCVDIVGETSLGADVTCCHNDMVAGNIVASDRLRLLDWEYAGGNDPFFDLGLLVNHHSLSSTTAERLLHAYTGGASNENRERLDRQRRVYDAVHFLWLAARIDERPNKVDLAKLKELEARLD